MSDVLETTSNPVGTVQPIDAINNYVEAATQKWEEAKAAAQKEPWWKIWKSVSLEKMHMVTHFLLNSLDDLVTYVADHEIPGPDKKATVLAAIAILYDNTASTAMPTWLKPFNSGVKYYIVSVLVSSAIDWIVDKYNNGQWRKTLDPQVQAMFLPCQLPGNAGGIGGIGSIGK